MGASERADAAGAGGFSPARVAELLGLPLGRVRTLARAAGLDPAGGFSFQDVVVLRALAGLVAARISPRRVRGAIERLRAGDGGGDVTRPLSGVQLAAEGRAIVVRDERGLWDAESGQACLDFAPPVAQAGEVVALAPRGAAAAAAEDTVGDAPACADAEDWYAWGVELEERDPNQAVKAYLQAIALEAGHADAHINLGRLLHEARELELAEAHYRSALAARPLDPTAAFNLAVLLDDAGRDREAIVAYRLALQADPGSADAHFNLARLYERIGDRLAALRHLSRFRQLTRR